MRLLIFCAYFIEILALTKFYSIFLLIGGQDFWVTDLQSLVKNLFKMKKSKLLWNWKEKQGKKLFSYFVWVILVDWLKLEVEKVYTHVYLSVYNKNHWLGYEAISLNIFSLVPSSSSKQSESRVKKATLCMCQAGREWVKFLRKTIQFLYFTVLCYLICMYFISNFKDL